VAYDNKTILDIVKAVDEKNVYKMADEVNKTSKLNSKFKPTLIRNAETASKMLEKVTPGSLEMEVLKRERKDIPQLAEEVLSEENPLAGGTFKGNQYFSNLRPQGKGDEKFSVEAKNIIDDAFRANRTKKDVLKAQEYLAEIEYIHPSEIDGKFGEQTRKALNRLRTNMNKDPEALYHAVRDINIFKRDK